MLTIESVFAVVFLWLLTTMVTGHFGLWPLVFVAWVACAIYAERKKRKQAIARVGKDIERQRIEAGMEILKQPELVETLNRSQQRDAEERAIAHATAGVGSVLTDEAIRMVCNPN
jgi:hypothetical protein